MIDMSPSSKTRRCVVILGAGASAPFDVPLADALLPKMIAASTDQTFKTNLIELRDKFTDQEVVPNMEEILTIVKIREFAKDIPEQIRKKLNLDFEVDGHFTKNLYISMKKLLYDDKKTRDYTSEGQHPWHGIFEYCDQFFSTTWCSFNWDALLETSFYYWSSKNISDRCNMELHSSIHWTFPKHSERQSLLKLHGGVSLWNKPDQRAGQRVTFVAPGSNLDNHWNKYQAGDSAVGDPVILEPSGFKYQSGIYETLKLQWNEFECELKRADAIIIIGYSLPDLDLMAREYLKFANEYAKVIVFDPCSKVHNKYKELFGKDPSGKDRVYCFDNSYGVDTESKIKSNLKSIYDPT